MGVLVSYYLPGNSLAPPPSHRASGATAQVVVEHAILGSVIFHPTWPVAAWWSTLILPVCDPPQPVCGHYNDAPSYFHCLAMKSAPSFSHMGKNSSVLEEVGIPNWLEFVKEDDRH